jgi:ABC-2 type transport system ATP-binding protein
MMEGHYLQIQNLTKTFKKNIVLSGLNLDIPKGKIIGIIGENGSGKTTLLNILIGYYKPDIGIVLFESKDIFREMYEVEQRFGFATQANAFYDKLSVVENLHYFGRLYNVNKKDLKKRIDELLDFLELKQFKNKLGSQLSTGMQRRLDIACSLIHKPDVLILDEPTEDLDPVLRKEILHLIKKINKEEGTTVIITSHLLEELEDLCDLVGILHHGRIVKVGTPEELEGEYSKEKVVTFELLSQSYAKFLKKLKKRAKIKNIDYIGDKVILTTKDGEKLLKIIPEMVKKNKEKLEYISLDKPSLDLIFEKIIKEGR